MCSMATKLVGLAPGATRRAIIPFWRPESFCLKLCGMVTPNEQNFNDYKKAEKKALELLAAMKSATPKKVDIELALLVAIFELHKGAVPAETVGAIIQGHLKTLLTFYGAKEAKR